MSFKVFTREELSNETYHDETDHISGSSLVEIIHGSPAKWKFKQRDSDSKALKFGTLSHTYILEDDMFDKEYLRATDLDAIEGLITSQTGLASALKKVGIAGTSGKGYSDLVEMMYRSGEDWPVKWLIEQYESSQALVEGKELVSAVDYDKVVAMREVLCNIPAYNAIVNSETAQKELSIFGEILGVGVKIRIDHVDVVDGVVRITDYKTTADASPEGFGKSAFNHGYLAKMALQRDLFVKAFNEKRKVVVGLLAQEKVEPYLPMLYTLTDEQLRIGRLQYLEALATYKKCKELDIWPGYSNGITEQELLVPEWAIKQYREI
ncbi:exonuclease VIII [Escherichia phage Rtp]|uniref:Exodeoxyribonuclease VIII (RecE) n=1 Tax=Escherichia phage Rtp TaxID=2994041 RepID=Q333D7_9CAUD|nr:exonuclease VIII [Escherichia phage Rtp]CAJ42251.1 putative exodeoxyribonuclease VIII (RecE) [Escherichia phage Rtp]